MSKETNQQPDENPLKKNEPLDFHGAAIIDEKGNEVPITEPMVQEACKKLDKE